MANNELLLDVLDHIKNNPQNWRQDAWFAFVDENGHRVWDTVSFDVEEVNSCHTAFCFAGHAALKTGFVAPPKNAYSGWKMEVDDPSTYSGKRNVYVEDYAREKLEITWDQADALFNGDNTLEDLEAMVKAIIDDTDISGEELQALASWYVSEDDEEDEEDYDDEDYDECGPNCWCKEE